MVGTNIGDHNNHNHRDHHRHQCFDGAPEDDEDEATSDEQVIVNQRCNIIIQYLDKHNRDNETARILAIAEKV